MGGIVGKVGQIVEGEAAFAPGETSLLFLRPGPVGAYVVTARGQGQFPVVADDPQQPAHIVRSHAVGMLVPPRAATATAAAGPGSLQKSSTAARSTTSRKRSPPPGAPRMRAESGHGAVSSSRDCRVPGRLLRADACAVAAARGGGAFAARRAVPLPPGFVPADGQCVPPDFDARCASMDPPVKNVPVYWSNACVSYDIQQNASKQVPYDTAVDALRRGVREVDEHDLRRAPAAGASAST